jgi:hypothetical protein
VSFGSGSAINLVKLVDQYCIGEVTMHPLPVIGLKQKSSS